MDDLELELLHETISNTLGERVADKVFGDVAMRCYIDGFDLEFMRDLAEAGSRWQARVINMERKAEKCL